MPTLKDVARAAGVSKSTVSRVFNNSDKVKPETRAAVRKAAKELNYKRSRVARRLRVENGQANMIGLVIPDIQNPFFADITRGVEDVSRENDIALILSNSDEDLQRQRLALDTLRTESVDGVIVPPVEEDDEHVQALVETGIPVVCVDRTLRGVRVDTITSDNFEGAYDAMRHLIELGHRRIGFVGGISRISTTHERRRAYEAALMDHDIPVDPALVREGDSRLESGRQLTSELLDLDEPPTATFTGNNLMTLGAFVALNEHGIRIPDDMAVVGYDDVPWASALNPPPTVVGQPGYEMGKRAAEMLLQRITRPDQTPTTVTLQHRLIVRQSCGASAQSATSSPEAELPS